MHICLTVMYPVLTLLGNVPGGETHKSATKQHIVPFKITGFMLKRDYTRFHPFTCWDKFQERGKSQEEMSNQDLE